ncbi:alpha/beta hydrolase family esterase [Neptuniibacter sp. QD37_11]|uniref:alpha/beta hydrolase family esterase n=1 Tax=Neptuniibacter sp. QD37_11 TaxID=3398209 RepID=UPI0039F60042
MKRFLISSITGVLLSITAIPAFSMEDITLKSSSGDRTVKLALPELNGKKVPVIIALHGGLGNAKRFARDTELHGYANEQGYAVAYLNGSGTVRFNNARTWNAGDCCGPAARRKINDIEIIDQLITNLKHRINADPKRIYLAGFSNGAMMAYRYACEGNQPIAGVFGVGGTLAIDQCSQTIPYVLHVHGSKDENVPLLGGSAKKSRTKYSHISVYDHFELLQKDQACHSPRAESYRVGLQGISYKCNESKHNLLIVSKGDHRWYRSDNNSVRYDATINAVDFFTKIK